MALVAGVDSSTQSCKVIIRDAQTGTIVRSGSAKHPDGTEVDPEQWLLAFWQAVEAAGGLGDVAAISIAAQQHGMIALDSAGNVIRPALLWNDTRSASKAVDLVNEFGSKRFIDSTGSLPVASFTITKLRWLRDNEPDNAAKVEAVALPHDWLTWRLRGYGPLGKSELGPDFEELKTDRSDASGTGYFDAARNTYDLELLSAALGKVARVPIVLEPNEPAGLDLQGRVFACGAGDNAAAALGLGLEAGDVAISIGTSGTVFAVAQRNVNDPSGLIAGFADADGQYLPIAVTLNAARVIECASLLLEVNFERLGELALSAQPGSGGVTLIPYFEGERTPNLPNARASLHGLSLSNTNRANLARAFIEGMLCGLADGLDALRNKGVGVERILLIGGAAQNSAVQSIASTLFDRPIEVPKISEYVAEGASVQAAWVLQGAKPDWKPIMANTLTVDLHKEVLEQYRLAQAVSGNTEQPSAVFWNDVQATQRSSGSVKI